MHGEYSMAEFCNFLSRIKRKIDKNNNKMKKKKMNNNYSSSSSCSKKNIHDIDDIDAKMNTLVLADHKQSSTSTWMLQQQHPDQDEADILIRLIEESMDEAFNDAAFAQDLDDMFLDNNTTTTTTSTTSNGDEYLSSQQQQQQPPAPTSSEGDEGNLPLLSLSLFDFQFDDSPEIGNLYSSSLGFQFDDPLLDIDAIIQSCWN